MRDRPYDEAELRRLMAENGDEDADPRGLAALADLFGAATPSPAAEQPLPGEEAAVAAFRAAHAAEPATPAASIRRRRFSRRTTALSVAVATLLGGGVAVATAATGHLPFQGGAGESGPLPTVSAPDKSGGDTSPAGTGGPSVRESASDAPGEPSTGGPSPAPTAHGRPSAGKKNGKPHAGRQHGKNAGAGSTPEGQLDGLCNSYAHKKPEQRKKALGKPAYAPLVDAAGGPDHVASYCADRGPARGGPAPHEPGHPPAKPDPKASPAPHGKPSQPSS